ncbi:MAG TPA: hypothetical protein V6D26_29685 [Stenomitos sp.]
MAVPCWYERITAILGKLLRGDIVQAIADALLGIVLTSIQLLSSLPRLSYILTR